MPSQANYWAMTDLSGTKSGGAALVVTIAGVVLPVAQFSMTYGLNDIPTATCLVALGRSVRTQMPSLAYFVATQLKQMARATVELKGSLGDWSPRGGADGSKQQWPKGEHKLFVGYVSGVSYRRSLGRVSLVVSLVNQLVDLSLSSGGSADVVPGAPHDLMLPTLTDGAGNKPVGTAASKFINELPADLNTDFSLGVLKALYFVSQDNLLQVHSAWCQGLAAPGLVNQQRNNSKAALAIEGYGDWQGIENYANKAENAKYTKAYPLTVHSKGLDHTAQRIGEVIASSLAGTSMWSMLIGAGIAEFGAAVIPIAQTAFLAPVLQMSRKAYKIIEPSDYADFDLKTMSKRPLYGVGVMGNYSTAPCARGKTGNKQCVGATYVATADAKGAVTRISGNKAGFMVICLGHGHGLQVGDTFEVKGNTAGSANTIHTVTSVGLLCVTTQTLFVTAGSGGSWEASGGTNDGMWMFVPAPRWMDDWTNFDPDAIGGDSAVGKMLSQPSHDTCGSDKIAVDRDPDAEVPDWNAAMEKYARLMYAANALRGREGTLVGKLRFDISPGTTLHIKAEGDRALKSEGVDSLAVDLFAFVARVTVTINAEQTAATTILELTNIRTAAENKQNRFAMDSHPFFADNFFGGAPLVPSLDVT
jgi:hypothetical protein